MNFLLTEHIHINQEINIKANLIMPKNTDMVNKHLLTEDNTKGILKKIYIMEKVKRCLWILIMRDNLTWV
jgi:hypothetical protein